MTILARVAGFLEGVAEVFGRRHQAEAPAHRSTMTTSTNTTLQVHGQGTETVLCLFLCLLAGAELPAPGTRDTFYASGLTPHQGSALPKGVRSPTAEG